MDKQSILDKAKTLRQLERHLRLVTNGTYAEGPQRAAIDLTIAAMETQLRELRAILARR